LYTQQTPAPRGIPPEILLPGEKTSIRADFLTEDAERNLVIGEGFVDIQYLGNRLQADHVEINTETGEGVAEGNVVFQDKENRLVCDRIEFNVQRQQAIMYGAKGELGRQYRVSGDRIERQDIKHYRIQGGAFSTCEAPVPEWQFHSNTIDVTLEEYAFIKMPTFWVLGFPVAFLPYMVAPVKTKRASGFLFPRVAASNRDGFIYGQDFFWAFSEHADATIGLEYRQKRGFIPTTEFRYRLSQTTSGKMNFKYLDDKLTGETSYRFQAEHDQVFGDRFRGFYRVDRSDNFDLENSLSENVETRTRRDVESVVNVQKNWDNSTFQFLSQFIDSTDDSGNFFQRAPDLAFNLSPSVGKLGPITISPSLNSSVVRFNRRQERKDELWRVDVAPRLAVPITGLQWFTFTPFSEGRATYYTDGRNPDNPDLTTGAFFRGLGAAGMTAEGPRFFRTYQLGFQTLPAIKHLLQTNFSYVYRPDLDKEDRKKIVEFDSIDTLGPDHALAYGWTHRILAKIQKDKDLFETREVFSFTVENSLDIDKLERGGDPPLGDVVFRAESKPFPLWRIGADASYDVNENILSQYSFSLDIREGRDWFLRHETSFAGRTETGEGFNTNFAAGVNLWKAIFIEGGARWATEDLNLLEKNVRFSYQACCWGLTFEFRDRDEETVFEISFNLVGLIGGEDVGSFKFGR
jgi:lipopolysaccharide assembly outer membrane protein LptD (OstA)